jgi:hypothetical protein
MSESSSSSGTQLNLIIKSANQKYEDFVIENCQLDWSVKYVKEHLKANYPNKPDIEAIRLIYSGKLLHDHLRLKECIRHVILKNSYFYLKPTLVNADHLK